MILHRHIGLREDAAGSLPRVHRPAFDEIDTVTPYEDDGYVRSDIDRPAMNQLREDVADGLLDCVVIYRIDRVCSDMMDFCTFYTFLKERGVKFVTVKDGIDTTTPIGEAMMYLAVIFSGLEIGNDAIRIRDNLNHLAARGFWCGGQPPIGYDIQEIDLGGKKHKTIVTNEEELAYKKELIRSCRRTTSPSSRWRPTAKITGSSVRGSFLSTTQLHQILRARTAWPTRRRSMTILRKRAASWTKEVPGAVGREARRHGVRPTMQTRVNHKKKHTIAPPENWRISIGYHEPQMSAEEWLALQGFFGRHVFVKELKHDDAPEGSCAVKMRPAPGVIPQEKVDGSVSTWYKCYNRERRFSDEPDQGRASG
ncbi:MAG: recombinase family protein [Clostridia bacterium]